MMKWIISSVLLCALGVGLALMKPRKSPKTELRVIGTVIREGVDWYELELTNCTSHDLQYLGFEPNDPRCEYVYWEGGKWKEPQGYRCGHGLGPQTLAPGASVRFTTSRPVETPCRLGVFLQGPEYTASKVYELEWLPERVRSWAHDWQVARRHKHWLEAVTWTPRLDPVPYTAAEALAQEALEAGVVMDLENLLEKDPYAAGPPNFGPGRDPFAPSAADPFAPASGGMAPARPAGADRFAPAPVSASTSP